MVEMAEEEEKEMWKGGRKGHMEEEKAWKGSREGKKSRMQETGKKRYLSSRAGVEWGSPCRLSLIVDSHPFLQSLRAFAVSNKKGSRNG